MKKAYYTKVFLLKEEAISNANDDRSGPSDAKMMTILSGKFALKNSSFAFLQVSFFLSRVN
ncbi:MAG: hypothetical protein DRP02_02490 [Candidatus Gerdarchaeota archaeon]|nr:MAG: hypothetical protein DRP02_02490 [Candidatus Gerdarchaeota archaeon]